MGTYATIRDAILTDIKTITGYGVAYNRERYTSQWTDFLTMFSSEIGSVKQIRGWWVTWDGIPEVNSEDEVFGTSGESYVYTVRGIQGMDDSASTETTFYDMIELLKNKLRSEITFGSGNVVIGNISVTIPVLQLRQFGSVLCHYGELKITVSVVESA